MISIDSPVYLTTLPETLPQCGQLIHLDARRMQLTHIPDTLSLCAQLITLDVSHNQLTNISEMLGQTLAQLEHLNLDHNQLTSLPEPMLNQLPTAKVQHILSNQQPVNGHQRSTELEPTSKQLRI